jgi:signal transduction histidine kinase
MQFAIAGLAVLLLLAAGAAFALRSAGRAEARTDAETFAAAIAHGIVEPALDYALVTGDRDAYNQIDAVVHRAVLAEPVVSVRISASDGLVLYSDERRLAGTRSPLDPSERAALVSGRTESATAPLPAEENRFGRDFDELLRVYLRVQTPDGTPLLLETYQRFSGLTEGERRIWLAFTPVALGGLLLLWLLQLPLAYSLVQRVRHSRDEREALLRQAVDASDGERRRIAGDLHDGVVQDMAGVAFSLAAAAERADAARDVELAKTLREAESDTRQSIRRLRSLLVEIYPPNLENVGLAAALPDLLAPLATRGIAVDADIAPSRFPGSVEALVYRAAQEALRNVSAHARASRVGMSLVESNGHVRLVVEDDGVGIDHERVEERRAAGHMGLRLLEDLAESHGGSLSVEALPGRGTRLELEVPAT